MTVTAGKTTVPAQRTPDDHRDTPPQRPGVHDRRQVPALLVALIAALIAAVLSTGALLVQDQGEVEPLPRGATTYEPAEQRWGGVDVLERGYDPSGQRWGGPDVQERADDPAQRRWGGADVHDRPSTG